ncbi:MAG: hypothetical protein U5K76_01875 [Woeseiaceae bacterium]|nr:hypothetical protein [Woeseiaceae bacterium]
MQKRRWSIDSLVLMFSIIVIAQLMVYVIPQGEFEREPYPENPSRSMVVPDTYARTAPAVRGGHCAVVLPRSHSARLRGGPGHYFLVFVVGGVIGVLRATGAIDAMLHRAVARLGGSPWILIGGCLVMFSLGSYTIGMGEEYVPLIPILVSMSLAMRMDAIVAMSMVWVPYGIGWACAGTNPFGVIIAQNIANVPITSGWAFRLVIMAAFLAVAFHHIYRYAMRVRRDPEQSLVAHIDYSVGFEAPRDTEMTPVRIAVLLTLLAAVVGFVVGAATYGAWYVSELMAVFSVPASSPPRSRACRPARPAARSSAARRR